MNTFKCEWTGSEAGFTLIEAVLATVLFALIVTAFAASYINSSVSMTQVGYRQQAVAWAQGGVDQTKSKSYTGLRNIRNSNSSSLIVVNSPISSHITAAGINYKRTLNLEWVQDNDTTVIQASPTATSPIRIDVTVSPNDTKDKFEPVLLQTVICSVNQ